MRFIIRPLLKKRWFVYVDPIGVTSLSVEMFNVMCRSIQVKQHHQQYYLTVLQGQLGVQYNTIIMHID